jgi:hypothetical protein
MLRDSVIYVISQNTQAVYVLNVTCAACDAYGYLVHCGMCGGMNTVPTTLDAWSRSSVVCVATSYGLDGQGLESR